MRYLSEWKHYALTAIVAFSVYPTSQAIADDAYARESEAACNHIRQCASTQLENIPPEYRDMMKQSLDAMCQSLPSGNAISGFGPEHKLYAPATACMRSISRLSCSEILDDGASTPECEKLENMSP